MFLSLHPTASDKRHQTIYWHALSPDETLRALKSHAEGLTSKEASVRLAHHGPNNLPAGTRLSAFRIFLRQFENPAVALLCLANLLALAVADPSDIIIISIALALGVSFGFISEYRSETALNALSQTLTPTAIVRRDGVLQKLPANELTPGDIVVLSEGDSVPADCRLIDSHGLEADESVLTGESLPVKKHLSAVAPATPISERASLIHQGTIIALGKGQAVVVETGTATTFGQIARDLASNRSEPSPLGKEMHRLTRAMSRLLVVGASILVAVGLIRGWSPIELAFLTIATLVAGIPEGLPAVTTGILARAMFRLLRRHALVRNLFAAETLGSVTTLVLDKTGTLTRGEMSVVELFALSNSARERGYQLLALASAALIVRTGGGEMKDELHGSPTDRALLTAAFRAGKQSNYHSRQHHILREIPFRSTHKFRAVIVADGPGITRLIIIGAPETLLAQTTKCLSSRTTACTAQNRQTFETCLLTATTRRRRAVAIAERLATVDDLTLPAEQLLSNLTLVGIALLEDPLRDNSADTIKRAHEAGLRSILLSGDHPETVRAIARDAGFALTARVVTGVEIEALSETALKGVLQETDCFARMSPQAKFRVLKTLQASGEIVAMVGDGVNDAPALQQANIGVAMNNAGDVSKSASDIVLLSNDLGTLLIAIDEGRQVRENLERAIFFLLYGSLTETLIITASILVGFPVPLLPAQILWVKLIEDSLPAFALAFEPTNAKELRVRGPSQAPLVSATLFSLTTIFGALASTLLFLLTWFALLHYPLDSVRSLIFLGLGLDSFITVYAIRDLRRPFFRIPFHTNPLLIGALLIMAGLYASAFTIPVLRNALHLGALPSATPVLIGFLALAYLVSIEILKRLFFHTRNARKIKTAVMSGCTS